MPGIIRRFNDGHGVNLPHALIISLNTIAQKYILVTMDKNRVSKIFVRSKLLSRGVTKIIDKLVASKGEK